MSLIHEALKKVERQRQLGKAPTLDSPGFSRRRRRRWPVLLLAVVVIGVCAWIWREPLMHRARLLAGIAAQPAAKTSAPAQPARGTGAAANAGKPSAPPPAAQAQASAAKPAGEQFGPLPPKSAAHADQARPARARRQRPGSPNAPDPTTPARKPATAPSLPPPTAAAGAGQPAGGTARPAPPPSGSSPPKAVGTVSHSLPMYWQLPYAERKDLPDLNITMHMYTDDPSQRFVILNGVRHVEGDSLESGDLKLVAITPDGITLERDGKRFVVPRQGSH